MKQDQPHEPARELQQILTECMTLQLATLGDRGPEASYTPFLMADEKLYVFTSELASHTLNMLAHPVVGVMLITDEQDCRNIFARPRLTLQCQASVIERSADNWVDILEQMQNRLGNTVELLKGLSDFKLICLTPLDGRLIIGFGQAYQITFPGFVLAQVKGR